MTRFETSVLATPEAISDLTERVMTFLSDQRVEARTTHHVALILDEVLTNLGTHGGCPNRPANIALTVEPDKVSGEIVDTGRPFDPTLAPEPSLDVAPHDRPIGGLGLHLVRKLSCALGYSRRNDKNCTIFAVSRAASGNNR
jgi:anti-sigma regulatory factor (Ser/Thr protein kinase)